MNNKPRVLSVKCLCEIPVESASGFYILRCVNKLQVGESHLGSHGENHATPKRELQFDAAIHRNHLDFQSELELELVQSHMTQKPMLRGEVDAKRIGATAKKDIRARGGILDTSAPHLRLKRRGAGRASPAAVRTPEYGLCSTPMAEGRIIYY